MVRVRQVILSHYDLVGTFLYNVYVAPVGPWLLLAFYLYICRQEPLYFFVFAIKILVVLTDGEPTPLSKPVMDAAKKWTDIGTNIYAIGIGSSLNMMGMFILQDEIRLFIK